MITIRINGREFHVAEGTTAAAAICNAGVAHFRQSVNGEPRGPLCGMGVCFECRVTINGMAHRRSCQALCEDHMEIQTDG